MSLRRRWMFRGDTSRQADLYGGLGCPNQTSLKNLREFVARLDAWPENAKVETSNGMVIRVSFWEPADDLTKETQ